MRRSSSSRLRAAFAALEEAATEGKLGSTAPRRGTAFGPIPAALGYLSLPELVEVAPGRRRPRPPPFRAIQLPYNLAMPEAFTRANQKLAKAGSSASLDAGSPPRRLTCMASASVMQRPARAESACRARRAAPGLQTDAQRSIQFVRSTPGIGTSLVGMKSVAHVEENAGVARVPPLGRRPGEAAVQRGVSLRATTASDRVAGGGIRPEADWERALGIRPSSLGGDLRSTRPRAAAGAVRRRAMGTPGRLGRDWRIGDRRGDPRGARRNRPGGRQSAGSSALYSEPALQVVRYP